MKICVSAEEPDIHALIAEEFGHSPFFLFYDTDKKSWEAFPNIAGESTTGAGIMAAEQVIQLGADVVLTGYVGVHGEKALSAKNIRIIQDEDGSVEASINRFIKKYGTGCQRAQAPAQTAPPE
jgi:predicted Fe-Mo cluster-binding NifX family protein